jgi:hypothetical protein
MPFVRMRSAGGGGGVYLMTTAHNPMKTIRRRTKPTDRRRIRRLPSEFYDASFLKTTGNVLAGRIATTQG